MLKPTSLLVGALMLTSITLAPAKADADKMVNILTMMEPDRPAIVVDVSNTNMTLRGGGALYDPNDKGVTSTTILKGNVEVTTIDKEGKQTTYKVKNGVAILTRTLVKASAAPTPKAVKKSKA